MSSFTEVYFNYGYNTAMEKIAAKKKEEEGMSTGAKAALGLGGVAALGGLGYGAHAGYLGDAAQGIMEQGVDHAQDAGQYLGQQAQHAGQYMGEKGSDMADYMQQLGSQAGDMAGQAGNSVKDAGVDAMQYMRELGQKGGHMYHDAKGAMGMNSMMDNASDMGKEYISEPASNSMHAIKEMILRNNPMR